MTVDQLLVDLQRLSRRGFGRAELCPVIQCPERLDHVVSAVQVSPGAGSSECVELFLTAPAGA